MTSVVAPTAIKSFVEKAWDRLMSMNKVIAGGWAASGGGGGSVVGSFTMGAGGSGAPNFHGCDCSQCRGSGVIGAVSAHGTIWCDCARGRRSREEDAALRAATAIGRAVR